MNNDLIRRYIYAVYCHLPAKSQTEVEKELENMISELLDARCGESEPTIEDVRAVLTELGPPEELAVKYSGEENKALISGIYLLWFKKILKIVLPIVGVVVMLGMIISAFTKWNPALDESQFIPEQFGSGISAVLQALLQAFFWIFIVFIALERGKVKFASNDFLSKLPAVPDKRAQIKIHDPIINIFWHIVAAVLFLGFPYLIGGYTESTGWVAAFDQDYIKDAWYFIFIWALLGVGREIFRLIVRRYTKKLLLVIVTANILTGLSAALFFANEKIMDPAFENVYNTMFIVSGEGSGHFLPPINLLLLAIILFALLLDTGVSAYRAFRYDK